MLEKFVIIPVVIGSILAPILNVNPWPFSNYPMFSKSSSLNLSQSKSFALQGVTQNGEIVSAKKFFIHLIFYRRFTEIYREAKVNNKSLDHVKTATRFLLKRYNRKQLNLNNQKARLSKINFFEFDKMGSKILRFEVFDVE